LEQEVLRTKVSEMNVARFTFIALFSVSYMMLKIIKLLCRAYIVYRVSWNELHNFKKGQTGHW